MAKISFKNSKDYGLKLAEYLAAFENEEILKTAIHDGAAIVADQIRANLEALPEDSYRWLQPGEVFNGLTKEQKADLASSFGLTPISRDSDENLNTKAGFDGYGSYPTAHYPQGVPNALLARSAESGSTVREKTPFVRTAVQATRKPAVSAMKKVVDEATKDIFAKEN